MFSFHLLDGLTGMADKNRDGSVNLFELGHYLDDRVLTEAALHSSQLPLTVGDRQTQLATVDAPTLADLRSAKSSIATTLKGTGMRGWEDDIVATADSATQSLYYAFADALKNGEMLDARASLADSHRERRCAVGYGGRIGCSSARFFG
ncbi:MAG: hypothetical protein IPM82_28025 [Saprospiraceae bacterium]|nr:hypothetical protein [Saprospiraceae bacterium]